jgi:tetratricopeptide (TPR) repeat protein
VAAAVCALAQSLPFASTPQLASFQPAQLPPEPVGNERCVVCHSAEVQGYARSAMAQSLRRAAREPQGVVNAQGARITMSSTPAGYYQTRENAGERSEYKVDYVVGSGSHASGYLVNIGGHLFQSPVAYYPSRGAYDLAPGYENTPDPDFTRPVGEECLLCHSGKPLHIAGTLNSFRQPVFAEEAIGCERCHGPVERHLADPRAATIVNPAKLEPAARDSVCEQCHLFGAARVPNPEKKLSDFIAGQRLEETFTVFHDAVPSGASAGDFKVISHVEQLALSACARNSGGRLWCGTCHDPHNKPEKPVEYYRARCLSCHTSAFPGAHPGKDSDCLGCHMPRREAKDGGHSAFTDHRIQRRSESLPNLPSDTGIVPWRQSPSDFEKRNLGIAYIDVGMQRHSSPFVVEGYRILTGVQRDFSGDADFFKWIGEALLLARQTPEAKVALGRALQLDPRSALSEAGAAAPYMAEGNVEEATKHLERAVGLDPLYLPAASTLIELYQGQGKQKEAAELSRKISVAMASSSSSAATADAHPRSTSAAFPKAAEQFKNIRVLKELPANQLIPSMRFMSSSLGVDCAYCHVEGRFDKDDKKTKGIAREMLEMVSELNKSSFDDRREVTCYSCHRGQAKPEGTPSLDSRPSNGPDGGKSDSSLAGNIPQLSRVLSRYVEALGGTSALEAVATRVSKGMVVAGGQSAGIEILQQTPGKRVTTRLAKQGTSAVVFDGQAGWSTAAGRPLREIHGADLDLARIDADLQFAIHLQDLFSDLRPQYPELIDGQKVNVLLGTVNDRLWCKLYFNEQSGLLVRMTRFAESPVGRNPSQIDYSDYRPADGVLVPFKVVQTEPMSITAIQLQEVRQNIPIDAAKFARPTQTPAR